MTVSEPRSEASGRPDTLVLPNDVVEFDDAGTSRLAIHNISGSTVAFRVLFTSPGLLDCQPAEGMVPPGKHIEAVLTTLKPNEPNSLPHRIVVRTATVQVGAKRSELWAPEVVQEHLRTCEREAKRNRDEPGASDVGIVSAVKRNAYGTEARLRAAERLVLTRSAQLADAQHRLAVLDSSADTAAAAPLPAQPPPTPVAEAETSPPPRLRWQPLLSHLCIGLLALAVGVAWAQQDAVVDPRSGGAGGSLGPTRRFWPAGWPSPKPLPRG